MLQLQEAHLKRLQPLNQKRGASPKSRRPRESAATLGGVSPRSSESFSPKALRLVNKDVHFYFGMYRITSISLSSQKSTMSRVSDCTRSKVRLKNFENIKIFGQLKKFLTILSLKRLSRKGSRWCNNKVLSLEKGIFIS